MTMNDQHFRPVQNNETLTYLHDKLKNFTVKYGGACDPLPSIKQGANFFSPSSPGSTYGTGSILVKNGIVYVSDCGDVNTTLAPGRLARYSLVDGSFLGDLDVSAFSVAVPGQTFYPQGMVFGPDGILYVTSRSPLTDSASKLLVSRHKANLP